MKFFNEFKEFAVKGNMTDMAIGIIIGAAFKDVINVLVKKIIMPPLTILTDGVNIENRKFVLRDAKKDALGNTIEEVAIGYGELFEVAIDFLIIAFVIFIVIKFLNSLKNEAQDPKNDKVVTPKDIQLLDDLKELMIEQNKLLKSQNKA